MTLENLAISGSEENIMQKDIKTSHQAQNIQTIANQEDNGMKERLETLEKETINSTPYLNSCIYPQFKHLIGVENHLPLLQEYAECSYLLYYTDIRTYTVLCHYHCKDRGELFIIAETENSLHGCFVNFHGLLGFDGFARFETHDKKGFQEDLLENSTYVGKTLAEIAEEFDIPHAERIPSRYVPYPHFEIERLIKNSDSYVNSYIMPKFTEIPEDSAEWRLLYDFCQGSILANAPSVLNFTVKEHYHDKDGTDYFAVQKAYNSVHYFAIHRGNNRDFIRYGISGSRGLKQCKNSPFIGKKLGEIVKTFNIPTLSDIPKFFEYSDNICNYLL